MSTRFSLFLQFLLLLWLSRCSKADQPENRTIDSRFGDSLSGAKVSYTPGGAWFAANACPNCLKNTSAAHSAYDGGWYEAHSGATSTPATVSMSFNGTALAVYCMIPNDNNGTSYSSNFDVILDDDVVYSYSHTSDGTTSLDDGVVYSNSSIENKEHTLALQLKEGALLFDYIEYTYSGQPSSTATSTPTSTSTSTNKSHAGAIAGGVVGGIATLAIISTLLFIFIRRRERQIRAAIPRTDPFVVDQAMRQGETGHLLPLSPLATPLFASANPSKSSLRRQEIASQLHDREQELAALQHGAPLTYHPPPSAGGSFGTGDGSASGDVLSQLDLMRDEIARLQAQQGAMMNEIRPPPTYS